VFKNLLLIFVFFVSFPLAAQEDVAKPEKTKVSNEIDKSTEEKVIELSSKEVKWFYPEIKTNEKEVKPSKLIYVVLSGSTEPGAKIHVATKNIPIVIDGKVRKYKRTSAFVSRQEAIATANPEGIFVYTLKLPEGEVRLPLVVKFLDKTRQNFQLNLKVEKKEVQIFDQKNLTRSPVFKKKYGVWLGAGFNYVRTNQASDEIGSDLLFESFKMPSLYAKLKANITNQWDVVYTYKLSPGETSTGTTQVKQGSYNWTAHTREARGSPANWKTKIFINEGQWSLRAGAQLHFIPYIIRESANVVNVEENPVTLASFGGQYVEMLSRRWDFEFFMRYQQPVSAGDKFDIDSSFAFDGSLGLIYSFTSGWKAGVFWYGQLHDYKVSSVDPVNDIDITAKANWFYSNIDLRAGYTW